MQDLAEAQEDLERHRQLLGGIIATIRVGDFRANQELIQLIRADVDLSQIAAHVRNECRSNHEIQQAYNAIEFVIDGEEHLPSPYQILNQAQPPPAGSVLRSSHVQEMVPAYNADFSMYGMDGDHDDGV